MVVIGGGGHALVVIDSLVAAGREVIGVLDERPERKGGLILGVPILGPLASFHPHGEEAIVAIGRNDIRLQVASQWLGDFATLIHPRAYVGREVKLGVGTVVFAGAVVQSGSIVGRHVIINTGATLDHEGGVGDGSHLCPGCHLAGSVQVGVASLVGTGATVIPGIRIGDGVRVGAGSVVTRDVPDHMKAIGVPARHLPYD